jgi:hypothetical protein
MTRRKGEITKPATAADGVALSESDSAGAR